MKESDFKKAKKLINDIKDLRHFIRVIDVVPEAYKRTSITVNKTTTNYTSLFASRFFETGKIEHEIYIPSSLFEDILILSEARLKKLEQELEDI